jgi:asparagine synthase (glutamine-hydrolysing)
MCGIAGYIDRRDSPRPYPILEAMIRRLKHRGPDGQGTWEEVKGDWNVSLGHRRLSIIDLDRGGQPFASQDGQCQITFNGEIFNFLELKPRLEAKGSQFRTSSDTEVLLEHCRTYGVSALADLNGMFAFGYWDKREETLLLARDRAGIKPLYYASLSDGGIAFSSELTSLIQHPAISKQISASALTGYFFSDYVNAPESLISGVKKLAPGHFLTWKRGRLTAPQPYWKLSDVAPQTDLPSMETLTQTLEDLLQRAVARQLIADVPVGVFLSGGIDSSLIAALAQRKREQPLKTFTIAFEDKDFDESAHAALVARHLGTEHIEQPLKAGSLLEQLGRALDSLDEPLADPSLIPTFLLSEVAAAHVKVVLGGDAGDELWSGYPTYRAHQWARWYAKVPQWIRRELIERGVSRLPVDLRYQSFEWKAKRFALRWEEDSLRRHLSWMSATSLPWLHRLFPKFQDELPIFAATTRPDFADGLNALQALDYHTYLPGSVLTKVDRASMAHGLEVRPPFLDSEVIAWSFSLPSHLKRNAKTGKVLLKKVAQKFLPQSILDRPKKGFGIPLARWLQGPLQDRVQGLLRSSPIWESPLVSQKAFQEGANRFGSGREDFSKPLWALLVLDHWMRKEEIYGIGED